MTMTDAEKMIFAAAYAAGYCSETKVYSAGQIADIAFMAVTVFRAAESEVQERQDTDVLEMLREFSSE